FTTKKLLELHAKSVFIAKEKPKKTRKAVLDGTTNVELFELLRILRNDIASENDLIHYQVFTQKALYEMCETLPLTKNELLRISDMGKTRDEKYGNAILQAIKNYSDEYDIETLSDETIFEETKPKKIKVDNKKLSLKMYKSSKSIQEIANERELNENTIFGHLASFVPTGEIKTTDLMTVEHYEALKAMIPKITFENLSDLKSQLDDKYTYGEIKLVLEFLNAEKK